MPTNASMTREKAVSSLLEPMGYRHILVGADASHHSNRAIKEAIELAKIWRSEITGAHVYAAKMHDKRFRQMEGGLPEEFKQENELERQRDIHDQLITKGLSIITDAYLEQARQSCVEAGLDYLNCSLEGKNYREMVRESQSGKYDLLVLGSLGLGAIAGSQIGSVCQRVVRRSAIDTLIIKDPKRSLNDGPIVVAVDGAKKSFGGLISALTLAKSWGVAVHVISAYDPYYHYVAFNSIAKVLSDEAGKIFRFKEQEKLHEDIIDAGLAKIYQGHLQVAESIAKEFDYPVTTQLLDGKPCDVIEKYVRKFNASLLVIGKLGVHADDELDIGGNAENLLRSVACALLIGQREYTPEIEIIAQATTSWTNQAEERMKHIPSFAQGMARTAILRYAHEQGHTVVTEKIVITATAALCPMGMAANKQLDKNIDAAKQPGSKQPATPQQQINAINPDWDPLAEKQLQSIEPESLRDNIRRRAEKKARQQKAPQVTLEHLAGFLAQPENRPPQLALHWQASALARLNAVPAGFMRDSVKAKIIARAAQNKLNQVDLVLVEQIIKNANKDMKQQIKSGNGQCPFQRQSAQTEPAQSMAEGGSNQDPLTLLTRNMTWQADALLKLNKIPAGTIRAMAKKAAETIAVESSLETITADFVDAILSTFNSGSQSVEETLKWSEQARAGIAKAPPMVKGMLIKEIENLARQSSRLQVELDTVNQAKASWDTTGFFHLDDDDRRSAKAQIQTSASDQQAKE